MNTKVQKWGNSLAVRLPQKISKRLAVTEGADVVLRAEGTKIVVETAPKKKGNLTSADWRQFVVPMKKQQKENVSENIDHILYGAPRR